MMILIFVRQIPQRIPDIHITYNYLYIVLTHCYVVRSHDIYQTLLYIQICYILLVYSDVTKQRLHAMQSLYDHADVITTVTFLLTWVIMLLTERDQAAATLMKKYHGIPLFTVVYHGCTMIVPWYFFHKGQDHNSRLHVS